MELENQNNGIQTIEQPKVISEEEYKNLQAEYTRNRQGRINELTELVKLKPEALASIDDKKLRDSVTKSIYGYESYETYVAIEGDTPTVTSGDIGEDEIVLLKKRVKQIEYVSKQKELDDAIEVYKIQNPAMFKWEFSEEVLREKLSIISGNLPVKDRVATAANLAFGSITDPTSSAYKALVSASVNPSSNGSSVNATKVDKNLEGLRDFLGIKKTK